MTTVEHVPAVAPAEHRPYEKPALVCHGSLAMRTAGGLGLNFDGALPLDFTSG